MSASSTQRVRRYACITLVVQLAAGSPGLWASDTTAGALGLYREGQFDTAFTQLSELAVTGDAQIQFVLGLMYANGQGTAQNFYLAGKFYQQAGSQGHAGAQINLASLLEECYGNGPCNSEAAAGWYRRAAEQDHPVAQFNLGVMYATGHGVAADEWTSRILFRNAAEQGYPPAQFNLAVTYEQGFGGPTDPVAAYAWYQLAALRGYGPAQEQRDRLADTLDEAQLQPAREFATLIRHSYKSTIEPADSF